MPPNLFTWQDPIRSLFVLSSIDFSFLSFSFSSKFVTVHSASFVVFLYMIFLLSVPIGLDNADFASFWTHPMERCSFFSVSSKKSSVFRLPLSQVKRDHVRNMGKLDSAAVSQIAAEKLALELAVAEQLFQGLCQPQPHHQVGSPPPPSSSLSFFIENERNFVTPAGAGGSARRPLDGAEARLAQAQARRREDDAGAGTVDQLRHLLRRPGRTPVGRRRPLQRLLGRLRYRIAFLFCCRCRCCCCCCCCCCVSFLNESRVCITSTSRRKESARKNTEIVRRIQFNSNGVI